MAVKSMPAWRMALPYVSPSMPTQAAADQEPDPEEADEGGATVGTVNWAETLSKVVPAGGAVRTAPDQFWENWPVLFPAFVEVGALMPLLFAPVAGMKVWDFLPSAARRAARSERVEPWGRAKAVTARREVLRMVYFILTGLVGQIL